MENKNKLNSLKIAKILNANKTFPVENNNIHGIISGALLKEIQEKKKELNKDG